MKKLWKSLFVAFAAVSLAGCSLQDLMFWKKSSEPEQQQKEEEKKEEQKPSGGEEAAPVLQSISVSGSFKTEYLVGEEFDKSGIIVTANYDKGGSKDVSAEASFSGFDSSVAGPCIVTVSFGGKSAEISLTISEPEKEQAVFPAKDVIAFFEEAGLDVVITSYSSSNIDVEYEIDDSFEGYFDVYVTGSSHEEMEAYKDACIADGWAVIGENEGDFRLQFGETNACVDLVDFVDYICVSFFIKSSTPVESLTPTEVMEFIGTTAWGYVEDGDFTEPDENGIVESNWTIGLEVENPEDSEECLNAALTAFAEALSEKLVVVQGPTYTANAISSVGIGVSEIYLITKDSAVVAYMYAYCYNGSVSVVFIAGPTEAFIGE